MDAEAILHDRPAAHRAALQQARAARFPSDKKALKKQVLALFLQPGMARAIRQLPG
jgi:hypothetical protein